MDSAAADLLALLPGKLHAHLHYYLWNREHPSYHIREKQLRALLSSCSRKVTRYFLVMRRGFFVSLKSSSLPRVSCVEAGIPLCPFHRWYPQLRLNSSSKSEVLFLFHFFSVVSNVTCFFVSLRYLSLSISASCANLHPFALRSSPCLAAVRLFSADFCQSLKLKIGLILSISNWIDWIMSPLNKAQNPLPELCFEKQWLQRKSLLIDQFPCCSVQAFPQHPFY